MALEDLVAVWRREDVARALGRLRASIRPDERVIDAAACQVRLVFRFTAVIAVTEEHLYVAFARAILGTTHALRLAAIAEIIDVSCKTRVDQQLLVRGRQRTWRFLQVEPADRAESIREHLRTAALHGAPGVHRSRIHDDEPELAVLRNSETRSPTTEPTTPTPACGREL